MDKDRDRCRYRRSTWLKVCSDVADDFKNPYAAMQLNPSTAETQVRLKTIFPSGLRSCMDAALLIPTEVGHLRLIRARYNSVVRVRLKYHIHAKLRAIQQASG